MQHGRGASLTPLPKRQLILANIQKLHKSWSAMSTIGYMLSVWWEFYLLDPAVSSLALFWVLSERFSSVFVVFLEGFTVEEYPSIVVCYCYWFFLIWPVYPSDLTFEICSKDLFSLFYVPKSYWVVIATCYEEIRWFATSQAPEFTLIMTLSDYSVSLCFVVHYRASFSCYETLISVSRKI